MAIPGVGASPELPENDKEKKVNTDCNKNKQPVSIYDYEPDGKITVDEQSRAFDLKLRPLYEKFKDILDKYKFNFSQFKNKYIANFQEREAMNEEQIRSAETLIDAELTFAQLELNKEIKKSTDLEAKEILANIKASVQMLINNGEKDKAKAKYEALMQKTIEKSPEYKYLCNEILELLK